MTIPAKPTKKMIQHIQDLHRGFEGVQSEDDAQVQAICDLALSAKDAMDRVSAWRRYGTACRNTRLEQRVGDTYGPFKAAWDEYRSAEAALRELGEKL